MNREQVLGGWARAPQVLTVSVKRRRLAFVGAAAPGVLIAVLGTHLTHDPRWLGSGAVLLFAAFLVRRLSERRFLTWEAACAATANLAEDAARDA